LIATLNPGFLRVQQGLQKGNELSAKWKSSPDCPGGTVSRWPLSAQKPPQKSNKTIENKWVNAVSIR